MRRAACRIIGLLLALVFAAHCGARHPAATSPQLADIARADALVREGCYRCLQEALGIYTNLTDPSAGGLPRRAPDRSRQETRRGALRQAFDVTLLLAVREKEIGLAPDASLARARALLSKLSREADDLPARLEAAEAIVGDLSGLDSEERQRRDERLQQQDAVAAADAIGRLQRTLHQSAATDLTAAYLALAIECERPRSRRPIEPSTALTQAGGPPLMQYRLAICSNGQPTALTRLREFDPRWAEVFFFEGKYEMGSPARQADPLRAAALLTSASEAFPESIALRIMLANAQEMNGEFAAALASVDRVLAAKPAHVDARLARVRTLSYLDRADEGIAAATGLIDLGTWHTGDAYYWRAWNEYQTRRLEPAWADIQQAMRLLSNTAVYALAGSIAYARRDLDTAVRHFDRAFEIDPSNCLAVWSAGLVHIDQAAWPPAADTFAKATTCFTRAASTARAELARLDQSTLDPPVKASRALNMRKRIESAEELGSQSALNAAQGFLHTGQKPLALTFVELAEHHPATRDKALALRPQIASMP